MQDVSFFAPGLKVLFTPIFLGSTVDCPPNQKLIVTAGVLMSAMEKVRNMQFPAARIVGMKGREYRRRSISQMTGNEQVRVEMQTFLQALASYVDHAAHDPGLTFEEHHVSLMTPSRSSSTTQHRILRRH